jgi:uroporphyrinogen decarboxylase
MYLNGNPPLYKAYCHAAKYFGIDGWYCANGPVFKRKHRLEYSRKILSRTEERITTHTTITTPAGELWEETIFPIADSPTMVKKLVKDVQEDFPKFKYFYDEITGYDAANVEEDRALCGDDGIYTLTVSYPGMHMWSVYFDGSLQSAIYAYSDYPEIFDEWRELYHNDTIKQAEILIDLKPDILYLGGSGTLTMANPELVRKFALPTIKAVCKMAKEAGILTMLHSCGKSMEFLDMLYNETDLNCINPLEPPPMGDVDLGEIKKRYGNKLCLMGNLNTTMMLRATVDEVEAAAKKAINDAGANGGFLLSTGDQLGRDTPEENIFKLVETAKTYGKY